MPQTNQQLFQLSNSQENTATMVCWFGYVQRVDKDWTLRQIYSSQY